MGQWEPIVLPLAVGAVAAAAIVKPVVPTTQAELDQLKLMVKTGGPLALGIGVGIVGAGILSLYHPKVGAGLLAILAALSFSQASRTDSGTPEKRVALASGIVTGGLAGTLAFGGPNAAKGASEVVIGYGGLLAIGTIVTLTDIARLPATLAPAQIASAQPASTQPASTQPASPQTPAGA